jgi:hypothetical protein
MNKHPLTNRWIKYEDRTIAQKLELLTIAIKFNEIMGTINEE